MTRQTRCGALALTTLARLLARHAAREAFLSS
jgi:hypothetical protein